MATEQLLDKLSKKDLRDAVTAGSLKEFLKLPCGSDVFANYLNTYGDSKKYWDCWKRTREVLSLVLLGNDGKLLECVSECYETHFDLMAETENRVDFLSRVELTKVEQFIEGDMNQRQEICNIFQRVDNELFDRLDERIFKPCFLKLLAEKVGKEKDMQRKSERSKGSKCNAL